MSEQEIWSIVSSIVSVILAVFSISLSLYFFVQARSSEQQVTNSLSKIEAQADSLQKLSGRWMDRLTKYVTEDRSRPIDETMRQLIAIVTQQPATITSQISNQDQSELPPQITEEFIGLYISVYYYAALTNYWSQFLLPDAKNFDDQNDFHLLSRKVVDSSANDFQHMAQVLSNIDEQKLDENPLANLLAETRDIWRLNVKSSADVFIERENAD